MKSLNYTGADGTAPLRLFSVIETSDGALVFLGVGYSLFDNPRTGRIYLIKAEAFLPLPSPAALPTPIPTPTPTISPAPTIDTAIVIAVVVIVVAVTGLLIFLRKRKH